MSQISLTFPDGAKRAVPSGTLRTTALGSVGGKLNQLLVPPSMPSCQRSLRGPHQ